MMDDLYSYLPKKKVKSHDKIGRSSKMKSGNDGGSDEGKRDKIFGYA